MSLGGLTGGFSGDQTSQSLSTSFKQSLENIGSVTVGGSGGSSSGRGGDGVTNPTPSNSNLPLYLIGGIAGIAMLGLVLAKSGS